VKELLRHAVYNAVVNTAASSTKDGDITAGDNTRS